MLYSVWKICMLERYFSIRAQRINSFIWTTLQKLLPLVNPYKTVSDVDFFFENLSRTGTQVGILTKRSPRWAILMVIRPHCHATFCPHPDNMQISPVYKVTWKYFLIRHVLSPKYLNCVNILLEMPTKYLQTIIRLLFC